MSVPAGTNTTAALTERQRAALVELLGDDDPAVCEPVRQKILACGPAALDWLRPHKLSNDPLIRRRVTALCLEFGRRAADERFLQFCSTLREDLEAGTLLLAQTQHPDCNPEGYRALLDDYAAQLRERLDFSAGASAVLRGLGEYLFKELGYQGDAENYYAPENSYLNKVMDRRKGNPISLCTLYLLVARRLKLPVVGIGLPGHFVCRFQNSRAEIYVDAFERGKFLTKGDCIKSLVESHHGFNEHYLDPMTPRQMVRRMCLNLQLIYQQQEQHADARRLHRYIQALGR